MIGMLVHCTWSRTIFQMKTYYNAIFLWGLLQRRFCPHLSLFFQLLHACKTETKYWGILLSLCLHHMPWTRSSIFLFLNLFFSFFRSTDVFSFYSCKEIKEKKIWNSVKNGMSVGISFYFLMPFEERKWKSFSSSFSLFLSQLSLHCIAESI